MVGVFGAPHFVSPDIQGSSVVSISIDQQNTRNIIITCKDNIKIYECEGRIVQQTWLCKSWLSPVAGCLNTSSGTFYCPISDNKLIEWSASDAQLHDIKPLKVNSTIHSLVPYEGRVYIVYTGGYVENVTEVCRDRQVPTLLPTGEQIREVLISHDTVTIATNEQSSRALVASRVHHFPLMCSDVKEVAVYNIVRPNLTLQGLGLVQHTTQTSVYTLWSNGDICCGVVRPYFTDLPSTTLRLQLEGNCRQSLVCSNVVKILQPTPRHIALMGQDMNKDGGRIVLWDFEVSVEIGNRSFKLYHPRLRCWVHRGDEERSGGVLLHERDNLSMMPLDTLPRKGRAQLLDTAAPAVTFDGGELVHPDGTTCKNIKPTAKTSLLDVLNKFKLLNYTDDFACQTLITWMKNLAAAPWGVVLEMVDYFPGIGELCVIELLDIVMTAPHVALPSHASTSRKRKNSGYRNGSNSVDEPMEEECAAMCSSTLTNGECSKAASLSGDRCVLVEALLSIPVRRDVLVEELFSRDLFYRHAVQIMQHLHHKLDTLTYSYLRTRVPLRAATWLVAIQQAFFQTLLLDQLNTSKIAENKLHLCKKALEEDVEDLQSCLNVGRLLLEEDVNLWPSRDVVQDNVYSINKLQLNSAFSADSLTLTLPSAS